MNRAIETASTAAVHTPSRLTETRGARRIRYSTKGRGEGGITRLMSPGDLGELVKPFVFLDHFEFEGRATPMAPMHPHSGIATHTTLLEGGLFYEDSTGKSGHLDVGSVEYMQAGGGVWHTGKPDDDTKTRGFQLWVALPPELELAPAESHYVSAAAIPSDPSGQAQVRVLLGAYGARRSDIPYPAPVTYLHVKLPDGAAWRFEPDASHDVAWLAVSRGTARVAGKSLKKEMAVFEEGFEAIDIVAEGVTELVVGSAVQHPHPLVTGMYSVHTSKAALLQGEAGYRELARGLRARRGR